MSSYYDLEFLARQRVATYMAEAAAEQLAAARRPVHTGVRLRQRIAAAICALATRLEPTPIQAAVIEASPSLNEWVRPSAR